jgi:hypothetical protein
LVRSVYEIHEVVKSLAKDEKALFDRLFNYDIAQAQVRIPPEMRAYCEKYFGTVSAVENQRPVKITNRVTLDTAIFNQLRARRPQVFNNATLEEIIEGERPHDPFSAPFTGTSEDIFGRVQGQHSITASNVAKFDTWHGVTIFNEYHPLKFNAEQIVDYLMTARAWAEHVYQQDPDAPYFFFLWNSLFKAGATITHGHAQMTATRYQHYGRVERLRRDANEYARQQRRSYFNDIIQVHRALGLSATPADRVIAFANLTPVAEREIWLVSDLWSPELALGLYNVLAYYKSVGAVAFNVAGFMPPIGQPPGGEDWGDFPVILRVVDRGDPLARFSDFGAMNLFAAGVVANDPFDVAAGLRQSLGK